MGHAIIENRTPFAFEAAYLADEEARPVLVTLIRATYDVVGSALVIAEVQSPVNLAGELHGEDAEKSSYKYEPEAAFFKPSTDVVLVGHAWAPRTGVTQTTVSLQVGPVAKAVRVTGDRLWIKAAGGVVMTRPQPFEKIPLCYERAFGGWDHTAGEPDRPQFEVRNPVGTGFRARNGSFEDGMLLPNIEDPAALVDAWKQVVPPAGFGFVSPNWQPRAALAGTYDEAWVKTRMPLLPADFDRRFFNAASPGLVTPSWLVGGEPVRVVGASPRGPLAFLLPSRIVPGCRVRFRLGPDAEVATRLDTVVVDGDEEKVYLTWRGHVPLRSGPHDVRGIAIEAPGFPAPVKAAELREPIRW